MSLIFLGLRNATTKGLLNIFMLSLLSLRMLSLLLIMRDRGGSDLWNVVIRGMQFGLFFFTESVRVSVLDMDAAFSICELISSSG